MAYSFEREVRTEQSRFADFMGTPLCQVMAAEVTPEIAPRFLRQ